MATPKTTQHPKTEYARQCRHGPALQRIHRCRESIRSQSYFFLRVSVVFTQQAAQKEFIQAKLKNEKSLNETA
jgi:hypothetical protein